MIKNIAIIYNPKSTGQSSRLAQELYLKIRRELPDLAIELMPTKYAGHAKDLAEIVGRTRSGALLVAVGGDGTYHEVINGVMALPAANRPICTLLAAGNANDHQRSQGDKGPLVARIKSGKTEPLDLLMVKTLNPAGQDIRKYAHSYVGFGMTARIAQALNKESKGMLSEKWIVVRELLHPRSFQIIAHKRVIRLYSLLCTNVQTMAKYMEVADEKKITGKRFSVIETPAQTRGELLVNVVRSTAIPADPSAVTATYAFVTISSVQVQLDGETVGISPGSTVTVTMEPGRIAVLA